MTIIGTTTVFGTQPPTHKQGSLRVFLIAIPTSAFWRGRSPCRVDVLPDVHGTAGVRHCGRAFFAFSQDLIALAEKLASPAG